MLTVVVAGLSLKNLQPRVWDPESPYYLADLTAIMVSYADFKLMPAKRRAAMREGLRDYLGVPKQISIFLDNGAFYFAANEGAPTAEEYREFLQKAKPDWRPIRFDAIPAPQMPWQTQAACFRKTMEMNRNYQHDGYVPVVHAGRYLARYIDEIEKCPRLVGKECIALGGLVPNLLRTPKAAAYSSILDDLLTVRDRFVGKRIHVFGIGGTATLHIAGLLGFDSADSSGWRNRAARGIIQLPGSGERLIANLGKWRGREPSKAELENLANCRCPACQTSGVRGLRAKGLKGFCNRATHNLWVLLQEARWVAARLAKETYKRCFRRRLENTVYLPLIEKVLDRLYGKLPGCHCPQW
jgi:hypothetical protein